MNWADDIIDRWHKSPDGSGELHEWLGMSPELYARWVENPPAWVIGIDEVGYGALAGPLVIGGVLARAGWEHRLLKDSKAFNGSTERKERDRAKVLEALAKEPDVFFFLHQTEADEIDRVGVHIARLRSFELVAQAGFAAVPAGKALVVIDGDTRVEGLEHVCLPKADSFVPHVSAASIVAKVYRDTHMRLQDVKYPGYSFSDHKGYGGSKEHQSAIIRQGLCPLHRRSYKMKFLKNSSS